MFAKVDNKFVGVIAVTCEFDSKLFSRFKQDICDYLTPSEGALDSSNQKRGSDLSSTETHQEDNHFANMQNFCKDAFQITMFCLEEEFNYRAIDLLAAAFVFEGKAFCVVQLPYTTRAPDFLQYFTCVKSKDGTGEAADDNNVLLYILHQKSLAHSFEVRLAAPQDKSSIQCLLGGFENCTNISRSVERASKGCMALVATFRAEIVGLALVDSNCPTDALMSHFALRQSMNINLHQEAYQAVLAFFFMKPIFANRQRLFLREIMRQTTKSVLFLPAFQGQNVSNMLEDLVLVPGRWHASMCTPSTWAQLSPQGSPAPHSSLRGSVQQNATNTLTGQYVGFDCSLFTMTHRLLSRRRTVVNSRIVVVGASQAGAACLNKLLTCTNLKFPNITLISLLGLKSLCDGTKTFLDVELGPVNAFQKMGINCLVNVIADSVIDLDRKGKCVQLLSGKSLSYDYLILATGLQDQSRNKIQVDFNKGMVNLEELSVLMNENASIVSKVDSPIVIYGLSLQTFCSINLLLSKGIPGSSLVVIYPELQPLDSFAEQCFQDDFTAASIMKEIRAAGVIERSGFKLLEIIPGEQEGLLQGVGLEKIFRASMSFSNQANDGGICIKQPCKLLVACIQPHVDQAIFQAVRKEGLVFNGRIVVDGSFQTNDPSIFACGCSAMFSRQCGKHLTHELFNSCDLGQSLAKSIISLFTDYLPTHDKLWGGLLPDPFETLPPPRPVQVWPRTSIPRLIQAKGVSAQLPGNFCFFKVKHATLQCGNNQDGLLQPLTIKKDDWLLKVEWTEAKVIGAVTYCGKASLEAWKFIRLAGCHDPLISNLLVGDSKAMVNISSFFSQPWFTLIFHDKFMDFYSDLCLDVQEILKHAPESQKVIPNVVKDAYIMFLNVYKADFPGLNFSSSWFSSKSEQSPWRGMLGASTNTARHSKARAKIQDDSSKELVDYRSEKQGKPISENNEVGESVPVDSTKKATPPVALAEASRTTKDLGMSEAQKLSIKEELDLAVEKIVEQIVKAQSEILSLEEGGSNQLSDEEQLKLVVGKIVEHLVSNEVDVELVVRKMVEELTGNKAETSNEVRVELVVRQMVEKLIGQQAKQNGGPMVRVRLTVVGSEEGGVLVEKMQVKLAVDEEVLRQSIGVYHCLQANNQHMVTVQLLVVHGGGDGDKPVMVRFEYPQTTHVTPKRLSAMAEKLVNLVLNLGGEGNVTAVLMANEQSVASRECL